MAKSVNNSEDETPVEDRKINGEQFMKIKALHAFVYVIKKKYKDEVKTIAEWEEVIVKEGLV